MRPFPGTFGKIRVRTKGRACVPTARTSRSHARAKRSRRNHELRDAKQMDQRRRPSGSVLASRPTAGLCFARLRPAHGREADAAEASAASGTWL